MARQLESHASGRGIFYVLEGLDGAGTTTQAAALVGWLSEMGIPAELTSEPSNGPIGGVTRSALDGRLDLGPAAMALCFAADRVDHLCNPVNGILQVLESGRSVVSDRYVLSSLAYQAAQGLDVGWLIDINSEAVVPDITIFVDTSVEVCVDRIGQRSSRNEMFHGHDQLSKIERSYRKVLSQSKFIGKLVTADGNRDVNTVSKQIQAGVAEFLDAATASDGILRGNQ